MNLQALILRQYNEIKIKIIEKKLEVYPQQQSTMWQVKIKLIKIEHYIKIIIKLYVNMNM